MAAKNKQDYSKLYVLVVDKSAFFRQTMRQLLYGLGVRRIEEATSGAEALNIAEHKVPDIVVVGWLLSDMGGLSFCRMLRDPEKSKTPYIAIIMCGEYRRRTDLLNARNAGATEFLATPFTAHNLELRIKSILHAPRPFIRTDEYFGPDRRRHNDPDYAGPERRKQTDALSEDEIAKLLLKK